MERVASAPQNLSLSPGSETVSRVVAVPDLQALTWHGSGSRLVLNTPIGARSYGVAEILGVDGPAAVALSPKGRIHLYAAGRYAYKDDLSAAWSPPSPAPAGAQPHLVVGPDGYALLLIVENGILSSYRQSAAGLWDGPTELGTGVSDYDALPIANRIVVAATDPDATTVHLLPGGPVASLEGGQHINLTYHLNQLLLGIGRTEPPAAYVARSLDQGEHWATCTVQTSRYPIESVAALPTHQGPYAAFWTWHQPLGPMGAHRYIVFSTLQWPIGEACWTWPDQGQVDALGEDQDLRIGAPGLVFSRAQQGRFRISHDGAVLAYEGFLQNARETDVFLISLRRDSLFSGPSRPRPHPGEPGPGGH